MKNFCGVFFLLAILGAITFSFNTLESAYTIEGFIPDDTLTFSVPEGWPDPAYDFEKNPLTKNGVALGRALFYDDNLSRDSTISCAFCHLSFTNFTHIDHKVSHGIEDRLGTRNTLSIMNPAWQKTFMWDGGVSHLDLQPLAPLTSFVEMDMEVEDVILRLDSSKKYRQLFAAAFGADVKLSGYYMFRALSQFMLTFTTSNSKYDQVMRKEEGIQFTEGEQKGLVTFRAKCASCHQEPLFTNGTFQNNGLAMDTNLNDGGRIKITKNKADSLKFRVPSLRNIEVSYPYMHDGRYKNLQMALFHYTNGIVDSETLAPQLKGGLDLGEDDKRNLVLFLKTLTDVSFLRNTTLSYPRY
jgi:cytochrome c peroxidase